MELQHIYMNTGYSFDVWNMFQKHLQELQCNSFDSWNWFRVKSHNVGEASYHIVFRPKYSHAIFGYHEPLRKFCETKFQEIAEQYGFEIRALEVMDDHVHLFVGIGPTNSVSSVVQKFKGISAHEMFDQFRWLKEYKPNEPRFWGGNFWSRGYFYRSVGSTTDEAVKFYINAQQEFL